MTDAELKRARKAYSGQQSVAKRRDIDWQFTFETWLQWWLDSGHWHERGRKRGKYVMARIGDVGPYAANNVFACLHDDNVRQGHQGIPETSTHGGWQHTDDAKQRIAVHNPRLRKVTIDGVTYSSVAEASKATGIPYTTVYRHAKPISTSK